MPVPLRIALIIAGAETLALVGYSVAIGLAARRTEGSTATATVWEILTYLVFAALLGLVVWGLWRRSPLARTPYMFAQVFVVIIGYTVWAGGTAATTWTGLVIMAVGVAGFVVGAFPSVGQAMEQR